MLDYFRLEPFTVEQPAGCKGTSLQFLFLSENNTYHVFLVLFFDGRFFFFFLKAVEWALFTQPYNPFWSELVKVLGFLLCFYTFIWILEKFSQPHPHLLCLVSAEPTSSGERVGSEGTWACRHMLLYNFSLPAVAEWDVWQIEKWDSIAEGAWGPAGVLSSGVDQMYGILNHRQ